MRAFLALRCAAAIAAAALAGPALAQATRTWVSGVGDDANPCSRTAPCKTFAGAISQTAAGGEIDALDPGGFGTVTITKSITLDGGHALAGIAAADQPAVVIEAGPTDVVVLRNLRLDGVATPSIPPAGILFVSGAELRIESTTITGFDVGVDFRPAAGGALDAREVLVQDSADAGVAVASGAAATPARATLSGLRLLGGAYGLRVADHGFATIAGSAVSGATVAALAATPSLAGDADLNVQDVVLSGGALGVAAQAAAPGRAIVRLSRLTSLDAVPAAHVGVNGDIRSFGDNRLVAGPDFALGVDPPSAQVDHGASATFTVSVTAEGISPAAVSLECLGLPAGARCAFDPATVSPAGSAATSTLTVFTDGSTAAGAGLAASPAGPRRAGGGGAWPLLTLLGLGLALGVRAGRRGRALAAAGVLALALGAACSGGGGGGGSHAVAPGTYSVTVRATAGLVHHDHDLILEVK